MERMAGGTGALSLLGCWLCRAPRPLAASRRGGALLDTEQQERVASARAATGQGRPAPAIYGAARQAGIGGQSARRKRTARGRKRASPSQACRARDPRHPCSLDGRSRALASSALGSGTRSPLPAGLAEVACAWPLASELARCSAAEASGLSGPGLLGALPFGSRGSLAAPTLARESKLCRTPSATTSSPPSISAYQAGLKNRACIRPRDTPVSITPGAPLVSLGYKNLPIKIVQIAFSKTLPGKMHACLWTPDPSRSC